MMSMTTERRAALASLAEATPCSIPIQVVPLLEQLEARGIFTARKCSDFRERGGIALIRGLRSQGNHAFDELFLALMYTGQIAAAEYLRSLVAPEILATLENGDPSTSSSSRSSMSLGYSSERSSPVPSGALTRVQAMQRDFEHGLVFDDKPSPWFGVSTASSSSSSTSLPPTLSRSIGALSIGDRSRADFSYYERNKSEVYANFSQPRGNVLIISNRLFRDMPSRQGTDVDRDALRDLFLSMGYTVQVHENLAAKTLKHVVRLFAADSMHAAASCAVLAILTHGNHGHLHGSDDDEVPVSELLAYFNAHNAPLLAGKPKIVILQACRGERKDYGFGDETDAPTSVGGFSFLACVRGEGVYTRRKAPAEADILVAYATPPFFVSWRNSLKGSWFIQALCSVIRERAIDMDLLSMLTLVNNRVASEFEATAEKCKQIPEHHSRLTKKFFFFPLQR